MTRKWVGTRAGLWNRTCCPEKVTRNPSRNSRNISFERLEDKRLLAFTGSLSGDTLTIEQIMDDGDIVIDNNGGTWRATDGAGSVSLGMAQNVVIDLISNTENRLEVQVETAHTGDLTIALSDGNRTLDVGGSAGTVGGVLNILQPVLRIKRSASQPVQLVTLILTWVTVTIGLH